MAILYAHVGQEQKTPAVNAVGLELGINNATGSGVTEALEASVVSGRGHPTAGAALFSEGRM